MTTDVLIVGAGPTGLIMANLLTRYGVNFRILDKKPGPSQESRAIVVHAKILELLDKIDLTSEALKEGEQFSKAEFLSQGRRSGTLSFLNGIGSRRTPYPFGLIYGQDQTEHLLIQKLTEVGCQVEWNTELLSLEQTSDGARARVRGTNDNEEIIEARWVVGADGSHSPVRHAFSLGFTGQTYMQSLFVADLDMEWELEAREGCIDFTRRGFFLFIPMRGEKQFRLFGTLPPELADRNTMTLDDVRQVLADQSRLRVNILKARWISIYHTHQRMSERFRVGHVFLAGDAAHIHSPAGGQGMNTGIGDAYNLAWKLALVVRGHASKTLLDSYEAERIPFARSILQGSDLGFQLQAAANPFSRWLKLFVTPQLFRLVSPLPLFRRRAFWLLSQLWTSYRNSPAVIELGEEPGKQGPRAGDRAPYGFFEAGSDAGRSIFTLFKDLDHHLVLFAGSKSTNLHDREEHLRSLLDAYEVPIHLHSVSAENRELHKLYRTNQPDLFLIRPDGHIAYHGGAENLDSLRLYLDKLFRQRGNQAQATVQQSHVTS